MIKKGNKWDRGKSRELQEVKKRKGKALCQQRAGTPEKREKGEKKKKPR